MDEFLRNILGLVTVYALIGAVLVLSYVISKKWPQRHIRKVIHIGIGNFVFIWWAFTAGWWMLVFFVLPFLALLTVMTVKKDSGLIGKAIGEESNTGLVFYVVSIGVMAALFFDHFVAASVGIVAMTYGDSMGSIVGKRFGKHKMFRRKSLEGTFAVFAATAIMSFVIIALYSWLIASGYYWTSSADLNVPIWAACALSGILASVLELVVPGDFDNLAVPIGVALLLCGLGM